jgi:ClpP class serine protease
MLDPFSPEKKPDVERLKALQADIHAQFIAWVKDRRGVRIKGDDSELFEGAIWTGAGAIPLGLVDSVGDLRGVMREKYGEKVRFMEFAPDRSLVQSIIGARANVASDVMATLEDRGFWQRFGL